MACASIPQVCPRQIRYIHNVAIVDAKVCPVATSRRQWAASCGYGCSSSRNLRSAAYTDANSIQGWKRLACQLEIQECFLDHYLQARSLASEQERFEEAAAASKRINRLEASNILHTLRKQQEHAVIEEDFARAASIRRARLGFLLGWWEVRAQNGDVRGHVLHITEGFGKLRGRVYSAMDLTRVFGYTAGESHPRYELLQQLGVALFEVIIEPNQNHTTEARHQPFFFPECLPSSGPLAASLLAQLSRCNPPKSTGHDRDMFTDHEKPSRRSVRRPSSMHNIPSRYTRSRRLAARLSTLRKPATLDSARAALERSLALDLATESPESSCAALSTIDSVDEDNEDISVSDIRSLEPFDLFNSGLKNGKFEGTKLTIHPHSPSEPITDEDVMARSLVEAHDNLLREQAHLSNAPDLPSHASPIINTTASRNQDSTRPVADNALPRSESAGRRVPASISMPACNTNEDATFSLNIPITDAFPSVDATEPYLKVARLEYGRMSVPMSRSVSAEEDDPLVGYFLGSYGTHGAELLHLKRDIWQGRPAIVARKITGDEHVPAGSISFRVHTDVIDKKPQYHAIMGSSSVFQGEGCASACGRKYNWMSGELVVFGPGATESFRNIACGAQLGFVWSGGFQRRFLILLTRLSFSSLKQG